MTQGKEILGRTLEKKEYTFVYDCNEDLQYNPLAKRTSSKPHRAKPGISRHSFVLHSSSYCLNIQDIFIG
jgi:hypothetical protein